MSLFSVHREVGEFRKRYKWMALFVLVIFAGVLFRMVELQLVEHDKFAKKALGNITKTIRIPAMRGDIVDAEGRIVATNRASYRVFATPSMIDMESDLPRLSALLELDSTTTEAFKKHLEAVPARRRTHQIEVFSDITRDQLAVLETHAEEFTGLDVVVSPVRTYPYDSLGAHAIGFVNEVNQEDLEKLAKDGYRPGNEIGRIGVERAWERVLKGKDGFEEVVVDVQGLNPSEGTNGKVRTTRRDPEFGRDVLLTLDMNLMQILQNAFAEHPSGAAVVVDVRNGEVKALYSKPAYDLNELLEN
ncbi:MAG: hypothetical protein IPJ88_00655 [Myxococcales bacterium]|nr:MAG: hypothetical protein IPJ88_00655 [Myxococcales bacterium]